MALNIQHDNSSYTDVNTTKFAQLSSNDDDFTTLAQVAVSAEASYMRIPHIGLTVTRYNTSAARDFALAGLGTYLEGTNDPDYSDYCWAPMSERGNSGLVDYCPPNTSYELPGICYHNCP